MFSLRNVRSCVCIRDFVKMKPPDLEASNVRVRGPLKTRIEWSEKVSFRGSETRLRGPKTLF